MSVKLSRYVFKKVGGSIIPIRKGLELATKNQSELSRKIVTGSKQFSFPEFNKLGSGIDFTAYRSNDDVIKVLKKWGRKTTQGTSNKVFTKNWPEFSDKIAVTKALSDNLPNFGIPTQESRIIRLSKKTRGILQDYVPDEKPMSYGDYIKREAGHIKREHGLNLDAHSGNIRNGVLIDTGANLKKSIFSKVKNSDTAKELLGRQTYYGTQVKDIVNKSDVISEMAAVEGQSPSILRKLAALKKKGFRFISKGKNEEYRLLNPVPTKQKAGKVRFIRKNGRIIPIRTNK